MIWNGYSVTKEREKKVAFTNSYMKNEQVLVSKKSSNITDFKDMKDKVLGAQSGSSGYEAFSANPKVLKDFVKDGDATQYETFTQALIDLKMIALMVFLLTVSMLTIIFKKKGILISIIS